MKDPKDYMTKEDFQFIYEQKALILLDIVIGCLIIFILANLFMLYTKNVFFIGLLPIVSGGAYTVPLVSKRVKFVREYWKKN